jgi:glycosyltransferase involved in cell wall biosynthesis
MRILFVSNTFPPERNAGAVRTYANCRRWAQMGHSVTVITGPPNYPDGVIYPGYQNRWLCREEVDGIQVIRTWMYLAANRGFGRRILNYVSFMFTAIVASLFAPPCDVVIGTSPQFFVAMAACAVAAWRRCPFIFEVRDLWPEAIVAVGAMKRGRAISLLHKIAQYLYRRAARVVVVTGAFWHVLESYGVDPAKIALVTNGVDLDQFRPGARQNDVRRELGLGDQFVASYVGTLGMAHGLETVLDAAQRLRHRDDIRFLIMGNGAERAHLVSEHRRRNLTNVLLLDGQAHERMPEFFAASDACMVLLRRTELFKTVLPSKIFEAMGAARPVILGVEGEAERVVRASGCGVLIEPENAEQLAEAVQQLQGDPEYCARLGQNGRAFAERYYDRDALAHRYASVIEDALRPVSHSHALPRRVLERGVRGGESGSPDIDASTTGSAASDVDFADTNEAQLGAGEFPATFRR